MSDDVLSTRYGAPSPVRRRLLVTVSTVVAGVFLGWLGWTAFFHGDPDVSSKLVTYAVEDEHRATASLNVSLGDEDVIATCLLRAIAEDHTVVGELAFEVTSADVAGGPTLTREVRTERRATTVSLVGCTTPGQPRPR
ncbi:DUF4307 domain-containing protein [Nocardioides sp. GCM10027113]|uniref:DUF4307 domain-containing protein n=1 Tax=unclassified Nocardioides TaxID=2615069 RepID=UPI003615E681